MPAATRIIQGIPMSHLAIGLAVLCFLFVVPAIVSPKKFREMADSIINSSIFTFPIISVFNLLVAFLILNTHWTFRWDSGRSLMTIIGYFLVLRSFIMMWFPDFVRKFAKKFIHSDTGFLLIIFLGIVFSVGLGYLGLWVY